MKKDLAKTKRFRDYGLKVGFLNSGSRGSIADVAGVTVGHTTIIQGKNIRTGVTVIDPGLKNLYMHKLPGAIAIGNGYGKLTGISQVNELGTIETPIALTNTLAVGPVMRGIVDLVLKETKGISSTDTINAIVGETNDGMLNDIHADTVTKEDVFSAYKNKSHDFEVGCVGAGTGTRAFSWKGGIGTASRIVTIEKKKYTIGVLVQINFGGSLTILGTPVGAMLEKTDFDKFIPSGDGSCMIVLATDAPLTSRQLRRIASRGLLGMVKTGSIMAHGSGDYCIAFSTSRDGLEGDGSIGKCLPDKNLTAFFLGAVESAEEAIYDALFAAKDMTGRDGNELEALPVGEVLDLLK